MVGIIVQFPARRRHDRASAGSRAAKATIASAVNPAALATEVSKIDCQYSSGMLPRWRHLRAAATPAPMSDAMASGEGHNAMTSLNDAGGVGSIMDSPLGQFVLNGKAILSPDWGQVSALKCPMGTKAGKSEFNDAFQGRMRAARVAAGYSQIVMAELLSPGMEQGTYKQYETRPGSYLPHDLVPRFCKICQIKIADLYGTRDQIRRPPKAPKPPKEPAVIKRKTRAA